MAELVPGGIAAEINASSAARMLAGVTPTNPVEPARQGVALEHLDDLRRLDEQMKASKRRIIDAVAASGTTLVELFGVGPIIACMLIGYSGDVHRFESRDRHAMYNGSAPIDVSSGGRITRKRCGAEASHQRRCLSPAPPRHRQSRRRRDHTRLDGCQEQGLDTKEEIARS